jgi:hypothetical protein
MTKQGSTKKAAKNNKKIVKKSLQSFRSNRFSPFALLVFAAVMGVAGYFIFFSKAAPPPPTIYLEPASSTIAPNGTFTVQVRANSGTTSVNAVQANFSYPTALLSCTGSTASPGDISLTGTAFTVTAQTDCGGGQVRIGLGAPAGGGGITGDQLVAIVTFHASTSGGTAAMAFTTGTALVSSSTNQDILPSLAATGGGNYVVDATPPTVSISSPLNNATLAFGNNVTVTAAASDGQSAVARVEIYIDGTLRSTLTASPYNYTWSGATLGSHTIFAKAYDTVNNAATSSTVTVNITDQTAPTVSLTSPTNNAFIRGSVTVGATATDNVGVAGVQFKLDGTNLQAEDTTSPYQITWDTNSATNGSHTLSATARDAAGNTTVSTITVTVDNTAPTASMTAPASGAHVRGTINVSASANDNIGVTSVQFKLDGANLGSAVTSSPYTTTWNTTTAVNGSTHTLSSVASDAAGNTITTTNVTVTVDNQAPTVSVTSPSAGSFVSGTTVTVSGTASDSVGVTSVQFKLDGANLGSALTASPYSVVWNTTTATNGSHTLTAVATDAAGNTTTSSAVTLTVDNVAPTVSITAPTSGSTVFGTTTVSASASDNSGGAGIARVEFYVDSVLKATDASLPYSFAWDTVPYTFGSHSLMAKAYDNASPNNTANSAAISVNVDNTDSTPPSAPSNFAAPTITLTSITLTWTASIDNIGVSGYQLKRNGTTIATLSPTTLTYTDTVLSPATSYSYSITAFDAANNFSTAATISPSTKVQIAGDINLDAKVDIFDLSIQIANWNSTTRADCDLNHNGIVDIFDLSILLSNYGRTS